jgi:uncharacterized protein
MIGVDGASAGQARGAVTIVTQTRVRPESGDAFARWQEETSAIVATFPGFIKQTVMPPSPPAQVDWVILQRFASTEAAVAWLNSEQRLKRVVAVAPMLVGSDDINLVHDGGTGVLPSPVSAVISTRIKPGQERAVSSVGATYRGRAVEGAGFSRLSLRAAHPRRAGPLARHSALRHGSKPSSMA